ncbi:hypothetical protein OEB99_08505 [Actinotalea sp. M2MS4P-6]|uniref:hypothetical protein n=1 Tax=Actinotalea sp. M2MS4P-6 TaxID=2983762 RepID=UPI0021E5063C|nr:hypothetical protein [Actinotalea sp. M2MS4P-6]MCV2394348.1 hypothetical protein [Actinotalea sp. M2MS4P-6]
MPVVVATTLAAAAAFAAFHVPLPLRRDGRWVLAEVGGRPARLLGIAYHLLLLPAVAALPAPAWAVAAGFAWMLLDTMLEGAQLAGATTDVKPLRDGVHVIAMAWLIPAGLTGGGVLAVAGTALALAFAARLALAARRAPAPVWLLRLNAALNVIWMVCVAVALR